MRRLALAATLCLTLAPWAVAQTSQEAPAEQTSKASSDGVVTKSGKTVVKGAKKGGEVTVDATKEAGSLGKKGVKTTAKGAKKTGEVAGEVGDATVETSKEAGHLGKETGKVIADGSKKTGETVAEGAKKTGNVFTRAFKKIF